MKKLTLTHQAIIVFTFTILLSIFLLLIFLRQGLEKTTYKEANNRRLVEYLNNSDNNLNDIGLITIDYNINDIKYKNLDFFNDSSLRNQVISYYKGKNISSLPMEYQIDKFYFMGIKKDNILKIAVSDDSYISRLHETTTKTVVFVFFPILILGNFLIIFWSQINSKRIKYIKNKVNNNIIVDNDFYIDDEISELALAISKMQIEIKQNEKTKQEMLQNVSHDFKTPISVIKSYSEAILDGIESKEGLNIIIKQTDILKNKVYDLLQITKLEYLNNDKEFEDINMKELINNIIINYKHEKIKFELNLSEVYFKGFYDNYQTVVTNIIDNSLRYAKSLIKIDLINNELHIFNDGEPIKEDMLNKMFEPYQKGKKGNFGLGMTIVKRTLDLFNMSITPKNVSNGVEFIIKKKEV